LARHPADVRILNRLMPTPLRPQWAMLTADALLCGYLGDERTLEYFRTAVGQSEPLAIEQRGIAEDIAARAKLWRAQGTLTYRASVPPMRIGEFVAKAGSEWTADAAFGIVLGSDVQPHRMTIIQQAAAEVGGSVRFIGRGKSTGQATTSDPLSEKPVDPHPYPPPEYRRREQEGAPPTKEGRTPGDAQGPLSPAALPLSPSSGTPGEGRGGGSLIAPTKADHTRGDLSLADFSTNPVERQIIERLKHAFDPDGVLNPLPWQTR
ncbi:MAG: hypothetical protein JWM97_1620, partial [Phycisphaerales bacterium]|nr:hypothetical protein [Phycisphaerales bacterium]